MNLLELTTRNWIDLGISAVVVIVAIVAGRWLVQKLGSMLTGRTRSRLDDMLVGALHQPLYWLLVVLVLEAMIVRLGFLPDDWGDSLATFFFVLYFIVAFVGVWRLTSALFDWYTVEITKTAEDPTLAQGLARFFHRIALIFIGIIGLIVLLSHFGANIAGLVTTLGVGSLAVALAAQAAFEDTITGFVIMVDKPYRVGDRIEILDLDTWGDVMDIGLRSTRIRTLDNRMVIVPNSVIGKSLIVNHSYPSAEFRMETRLGVAYGTDLELVRQTLVDAVHAVEGVLPDRPVEVLLYEFGNASLELRVLWWNKTYAGKRLIVDRVNSAIYRTLTVAGIQMSTPNYELHHRLAPDEVERIVAAINRHDGGSRSLPGQVETQSGDASDGA